MNGYEKALEAILTKPYISKNIVRNYLGSTNKMATNIFDGCKELELQSMPFDPRPHRIMVSTLMKYMKLDFNLIKKQYNEALKIKERVNDEAS